MRQFATIFHFLIYISLQDEYSILNSKHAIGIHGYVLVYSVTSRNSFDMIQIVYDKIIDFCGMNDIPCVIVGSKTDLQTRLELHSGSVVVSVGRFQRQSVVLTVPLGRWSQKKERNWPRKIRLPG